MVKYNLLQRLWNRFTIIIIGVIVIAASIAITLMLNAMLVYLLLRMWGITITTSLLIKATVTLTVLKISLVGSGTSDSK